MSDVNYRFKVGEIAIIAIVLHPKCSLEIGDEVTVSQLGPVYGYFGTIPCGPFDYAVTDSNGKEWVCYERELRKRRPPGAELVKKYLDNMPRQIEETV